MEVLPNKGPPGPRLLNWPGGGRDAPLSYLPASKTRPNDADLSRGRSRGTEASLDREASGADEFAEPR